MPEKSAFAKTAEALCRRLGAIDGPRSHPDYIDLEIQTKYGKLYLYPRESAIRARFDQKPPVQPSGAPLNPFSFKWNFEFCHKRSPEDMAADLAYFERCLRPLLVI
jgi:hypothetical protein